MTLHLRSWLGSIAAIFVLTFATTPVLASGWKLLGDATPAPRKETLWGLPRDDPAIAVGAIVAALALFAVVAWVGSHIGDKS